MAYTDFTLENVQSELGIIFRTGSIFPELTPCSIPSWLQEILTRGSSISLLNEKSRSEYIVAPILLEVRESSGGTVAIFSGQRLDVDAARKLQGECDFLLTRSDTVPILRAPIMAIVEAKKQDIEAGIGQCMAQMVASQIFNEKAGQPVVSLYGCVTTGETWQFLRLTGTEVTLHHPRYYIDNLGMILAAFAAAVRHVP